MKRIIVCALMAMGLCLPSMAQITEGVPTAKTIRTGNRVKKGDFGIYMGVSSNMFKDMFDKDVKFDNPLPLVNLKYMVTDRVEARLGLQFSKTREKLSGDVYTDIEHNKTVDYSNKYVKSTNLFQPGIAYHFSRSNILDVYAGAELPFGWSRDVLYDGSYDDNDSYMKKGAFNIGLGAFIGLQAYIGDLPLALGVEYGISSMADLGCKYKVKEGDTEYQVPDYNALKNMGNQVGRFDGLKARKGQIGNQFRVTLTYFFK